MKITKKWGIIAGMIAIVSSLLIVTFGCNKPKTEESKNLKIAFLKFVSTSPSDDSVKGCVDQMEARGHVDGKDITIKYFCADGDMSTANSIAKEILSSDYDMVLTVSTPCLQIVANANKTRKMLHVFGFVTDPFAAGVGINKDNHADHPPYLNGIGNFEPVERAFRLAKEMYPDLKTVGTPWSSGEACAQACVIKARKVCGELGITLMEKQTQNSNEMMLATQSLISSGAEAIWIGGDNAGHLAMDTIIKAATDAKIPVFVNSPEDVEKGALFAVGSNFYEVGKIHGNLVSDFIEGKKDPATTPVDDVIYERVDLNKKVLKTLRDGWFFPEPVLAKADSAIEEDGQLTVLKKPPAEQK